MAVEIVRSAYDKIAFDYDSRRNPFDNALQLETFEKLLKENNDSPKEILDAGCGSGKIADYFVKRGFSVIGIDISLKMLQLSHDKFPKSQVIEMDMRNLGFQESSFDGIISFYALIHVPRNFHNSILENFKLLLKPNGCIIICVGRGAWERIEEYRPFGVTNYWSYHDPSWYSQKLRDIGFQIFFERLLEQGGETFYWLIGKKPK